MLLPKMRRAIQWQLCGIHAFEMRKGVVMHTQIEKIGEINLGARVRVSDPCYGMDVWCAGTLENVHPGRYKCRIVLCEDDPEHKTGFFSRVKSMSIHHVDYDVPPQEYMPFDVGVDSGQAGFYDADYFAKFHAEEVHLNEEWYDRICEVTIKQVHNPAYIDRESYLREAMGTRYHSDEELSIAVAAGTMTAAQAESCIKERLNLSYSYVDTPMIHRQFFGIGYAGILDGLCFVSSTGYGDGGYDCYVGRNASGQIVSAEIIFIGD